MVLHQGETILLNLKPPDLEKCMCCHYKRVTVWETGRQAQASIVVYWDQGGWRAPRGGHVKEASPIWLSPHNTTRCGLRKWILIYPDNMQSETHLNPNQVLFQFKSPNSQVTPIPFREEESPAVADDALNHCFSNLFGPQKHLENFIKHGCLASAQSCWFTRSGVESPCKMKFASWTSCPAMLMLLV